MNLRKLIASRVRGAALIAAVGLLAFASSAAAVVFIYKNGFDTRSEYKEIEQTRGGDSCDKDFLEESDSMRIEVAGRGFCEYSPPVVGDRNQPDHEIVAEGRILSDTPKNVREKSYLAVRVRVGRGSHYELQVNPKLQTYKLDRDPSGAGLPLTGNSDDIKRINEDNTLGLRVTGDRVSAFVNGTLLESYDDPQVGQVDGRKVSFGLGNTKDSQRGPIGIFKSIKVGVPNP